MPTYRMHGHEIYVESSGPEAGPPVVLLHHGLGSLRAWRAQVPALQEAGYRVIAYDRWGYGKSSPRPGTFQPYFEADQADLLALLDELKVERAALVAHSDGATLALYFALSHPERVAGLISVAAHIYVEAKMETGIESVRRDFESDERFQAGLERVHGAKAAQVFDHWYSGWRQTENLAWDMRPALAGVKCPVLVVQGDDDEHATARHARDLAAALPVAELWLVPDAPHMLPQERPDLFNPRMIRFIKGLEFGEKEFSKESRKRGIQENEEVL